MACKSGLSNGEALQYIDGEDDVTCICTQTLAHISIPHSAISLGSNEQTLKIWAAEI